MNILVTGGAGYIGSHTTRILLENDHDITVIDNFSTGDRRALQPKVHVIEGDFGDPNVLDLAFGSKTMDLVIHCAASIDVAESEEEPLAYFENNFVKTKTLLEKMDEFSITKMIFSSTACVYKETGKPVTEESFIEPKSAYGRSKAMVEWMVQSYATAQTDFSYIILRYFNVAGAEPDGSNGQYNQRANHLIRKASQAANGSIPTLTIFGDDYPTEDGSCIRDFIHIKDLALIHGKAADYLENKGSSKILNCGYGKGYSVKEIANLTLSIAPHKFQITVGDRRPGDLMEMVSDNSLLTTTLNWSPQFNDLKQICQSSIAWEKSLSTTK